MQHALPRLTTDHHRRGGAVLAHALATIRAHQRDRPGDDLPAYALARLVNVCDFLEHWPLLQWTPAWQHWQLAGKMPRPWGDVHLPGADHTSYWRVRGVRGPILACTFPYAWGERQHAEALRFAELRGLLLEVRPVDVPDLWNPGATVPIVWSRGGVDWRALAGGAAGAAGAAGGTVDAQGAHGATRAAGAAGAPQGVWGNECAQKPAADGPAA